MTKFKVGDKVEIVIACSNTSIGEIYVLTEDSPSGSGDGPWAGSCNCGREYWKFALEHTAGTRKDVNYILQYELDEDPFETFETLAEVKDRIKVLALDHTLKRESLVVYEVARTMKVTLDTAISFAGPKHETAPELRNTERSTEGWTPARKRLQAEKMRIWHASRREAKGLRPLSEMPKKRKSIKRSRAQKARFARERAAREVDLGYPVQINRA